MQRSLTVMIRPAGRVSIFFFIFRGSGRVRSGRFGSGAFETLARFGSGRVGSPFTQLDLARLASFDPIREQP